MARISHYKFTTNSTYISILSVPINDILKTDSALNLLKTNSVLTNIEIQLQYSVYPSRSQL